MSRVFAYCRVSTSHHEQTTANQVLEIERSGFAVKPSRCFEETVSGSVPAAERPVFSSLLDRLEEDDVLVVTKLDRLGRNASDIRQSVERLAGMGVRVHCLQLGGVDLSSPAGKLQMQIIGAFAEFERDLLIERTRAGLERAKSEGVELGRKRSYTPEQAAQIRQAVASGECSIRGAAKLFGVSAPTVQRILKGEACV